MKYTIPYDDKITLPHIKNIEKIEINADKLSYDRKEVSGEVIITGDYTVDNTNDLMEFIHEIPVSLLIDDAEVEPQINISNFKYELIPGKGIEVIFDLDVVLEKDEEICDEDIEREELEDLKIFQEQIDKNLTEVLNTDEREEGEKLEIEEIEDAEIQEDYIDEVIAEEKLNTTLESTLSSFDTSFVPRDNDKFTTYKILLIEKNESIDQLLEARNLSRALICKEYDFDEKKIVLKLEND